MLIIERVNLIHESRRAEMNIRTNTEKELLDVGRISNRDIEENIVVKAVAVQSRRKRDILCGLQRFRLIEGHSPRNP